jgi:hypothetical protein
VFVCTSIILIINLFERKINYFFKYFDKKCFVIQIKYL